MMVECNEQVTGVDPIADGEAHLGDDRVAGGDDLVLHLHRLDDHQQLTVDHRVTGGDVDGDHGARQRTDRPAGRRLGVVQHEARRPGERQRTRRAAHVDRDRTDPVVVETEPWPHDLGVDDRTTAIDLDRLAVGAAIEQTHLQRRPVVGR